MKTTEKALNEYGLDYKLMTASAPAMTTSLDKAIRKKEWIVVTGWTPHWMFGRYKLKILNDPNQIYGKAESIHTVVWKDFSEKYPFVAELLRNIRLDDQQISSLMATIEKTHKTETYAVRQWMKEHQALVDSWIPIKTDFSTNSYINR